MNDHYNTYSVEDLIQDEEFLRWVLNPTEDTRQNWTKWIEQNPEHKAKVEEARSMLRSLSFKKVDTQGMSAKIWDQIQMDIQKEATPTRAKTRILPIITAISAAAAILLLLIVNYSGNQMTTIEAAAGLATIHQLPDQSEIRINDGSSISYDKNKFAVSRDIYLDGEAFFQVSKGSPFTVHTDLGTVQVLGTSFNIFNHSNHFDVICKTGKVKVVSGDKELILTPGEKAYLNEVQGLTKFQLDTVEIDWLNGTFKYENTRLAEVAAELERQYDIHITMPQEAKDLLYTGFFIDNDLDQALSSVFWPLKLKYEKKNNKINISRED
ncbi:MAG: FecR family protein [Saprospiraceae bacterium]|nr:FecR family protein [Saprospiraceae bacterium]